MGDAAAAAWPDLRAGVAVSLVGGRGRRALTSATLSLSRLRGQIHYEGPDPELSVAGHTQPIRRRAVLRPLAGKRSVSQTPAPCFDS